MWREWHDGMECIWFTEISMWKEWNCDDDDGNNNNSKKQHAAVAVGKSISSHVIYIYAYNGQELNLTLPKLWISIVSIHSLFATDFPTCALYMTIIMRKLIVGTVVRPTYGPCGVNSIRLWTLTHIQHVYMEVEIEIQVNKVNQKNVSQTSQQQNWLLCYEEEKP